MVFFWIVAALFMAGATLWTVAIEPQWPGIKRDARRAQEDMSEQHPVYGAVTGFLGSGLELVWVLARLALVVIVVVWFVGALLGYF